MAKESVFRHPVSGPAHARDAPHPGRPRRRLGGLPRGAGGAQGGRARRASSPRRRSAGPSSSRSSRPARRGWRRPPASRWCRPSSGAASGSTPRAGPRDFRGRGKAITVAFGEPLTPGRRDNGDAVTAELQAGGWRPCWTRSSETYPDRPPATTTAGGCRRRWAGTAPDARGGAALDAAEAESRGRPERRTPKAGTPADGPGADSGPLPPGGARAPAPEGLGGRRRRGRWPAGLAG